MHAGPDRAARNRGGEEEAKVGVFRFVLLHTSLDVPGSALLHLPLRAATQQPTLPVCCPGNAAGVRGRAAAVSISASREAPVCMCRAYTR